MNASREDDPLIGRCLGEFQIVRLIGRGGMGATVYEALQLPLDRLVAIKVLPREGKKDAKKDARFAERFLREARVAAAVTHPNIVPIHAVGEDGEYLYIVMELVEGGTLEDALKRDGKVSPRRVVEVMKQVAAALVKAHAAGAIHRDIKPSNLLVSADGVVKVTDFGLAKRPGVDVTVTQPHEAVGTPRYMAPEVALCERVDERSDLYSLGATAYHLLAGRPPFSGATNAQLMLHHVLRRPTPLQKVAPELPSALCGIVHRLLLKPASARFQSARELLDALECVDLNAATEPKGLRGGGRCAEVAHALRSLVVATPALLRLAWARALAFRGRLRREWVPAAVLAGALVCVILLLLVASLRLGPNHAPVPSHKETKDTTVTKAAGQKDGRGPMPKPTSEAPPQRAPEKKQSGTRTSTIAPPVPSPKMPKPPEPPRPIPPPPGPPKKEVPPPVQKVPPITDLAAMQAAGGWRRDFAVALRRTLSAYFEGVSIEEFAESMSDFHELDVIVHPGCTRGGNARTVEVAYEEVTLASLLAAAARSAHCAVGLVDHAIYIAPSQEEVNRAAAVVLPAGNGIPADLATKLEQGISVAATDRTLAEAASDVRRRAAISVVVVPGCAKRTLTLRVNRMPAGSVLLWLARLTDSAVLYENGVFTLVPRPAQGDAKPKAP